jgi:hypothetical protein
MAKRRPRRTTDPRIDALDVLATEAADAMLDVFRVLQPAIVRLHHLRLKLDDVRRPPPKRRKARP